MNITDESVKAFTQYRRSQVAELRPWQSGDDMSGVSVSAEDAKAGSPKSGDMIARNPKNYADQWLVEAAYFADNFEPLAALPHLSQGAVTDEMVEIVAKKIADFLGYAWGGLNNHSVVEQGYPLFTYGHFGWSFHGGQPDLRNVARDLLEAALASHEPALEMCATDGCENRATHWRGKLGVGAFYCETCDGKIAAGIAKEPSPSDTQEGLSEAGEVVAWRAPINPYGQPGFTYTSTEDELVRFGHHQREPLVRQSALTACQQEVERLREEKRDAYHDGYASRDGVVNACRKRAETAEDRNAELEDALEPFAAVLSRYTFSEHQLILLSEDNPVDRRLNHLRPEDFDRARVALGGRTINDSHT